MPIDVRNLKPSDLARLLNSTPLGTVIDERQLYRHRMQAGFRIGDGRRVDLLRYLAWLVERKHAPRPVVDPVAAYEAMKEAAALRNRVRAEAGRDRPNGGGVSPSRAGVVPFSPAERIRRVGREPAVCGCPAASLRYSCEPASVHLTSPRC